MPADLPKWHVDSPNVHQQTTLAPRGNGLVDQWVVPYIVDSGPAKGTTHDVTVPAADFTAAGVREAIEQHLNNVHGVASLSSDNA